jgi:hypothetical protein
VEIRSPVPSLSSQSYWNPSVGFELRGERGWKGTRRSLEYVLDFRSTLPALRHVCQNDEFRAQNAKVFGYARIGEVLHKHSFDLSLGHSSRRSFLGSALHSPSHYKLDVG